MNFPTSRSAQVDKSDYPTGVRPWGELPVNILAPMLASCSSADAASFRCVCKHWLNTHRDIPVSLSPILLDVSKLLSAAPRVHELHLSKTGNLADTKQIRALANLPELATLTLRSMPELPAASLLLICKISTLTSLDLSGCAVDDRVLQKLAESLAQLKSLSLCNCSRVGPSGLSAIADNQTHLSELNLQGHSDLSEGHIASMSRMASLTILDLSGCKGLGVDGLRQLIPHLPRLRVLSLSGCPALEDEEAMAPLAKLKLLESLDISHCPKLIKDSAIRQLAATRLCNLRVLDVSMCLALTDTAMEELAGNLSSLSSLGLGWCSKLTSTGLQALARMSELVSLNLTGCSLITDDGLKPLSSLRRISKLRIAHCNLITAEGLVHIGRLRGLTELSLSGLQNVNAAALQALQGLSLLSRLEVGSCKGVDEAACAVIALFTQLCHLSMPRCPLICDAALAALAPLQKLQFLDLRKCRHFSEHALVLMFAAHLRLKAVDARDCFQLLDKSLLMEKAAMKNVQLLIP